MKVAILTESSIDDAAIQILVQAIVLEEIEFISTPSLETRDTKKGGYSNLRKHLSNFLQMLHHQTETECVVVVVDSDDDPIHQAEHDEEGKGDAKCRLCSLRQDIKKIQSQIKPSDRKQIKIAIGLAVPAIEAWFRCLEDSHITEATWLRWLNNREKAGYNRDSLKKDVYSGVRTDKGKKEIAVEAANNLANNLELLEQLFPQGFGSLVKDIRNW